MNPSFTRFRWLTRSAYFLFAALLVFLPSSCNRDNETSGLSVSAGGSALAKATDKPDPAGNAVLKELGIEDLQAPRKKPSINKEKAEEAKAKEAAESWYKRPAKWIEIEDLPYEFWEVQFSGNQAIGYFHQKVSTSSIGSAGIYRIDADAFRRAPLKTGSVDQFLRVMTIEDIDGNLRTIEATIKQNGDETKLEGSVVIDDLRLKIQRSGTTTGKEIPWESRFGGPFATSQVLRGKPMTPNESRSFSWIDPLSGELLKMELQAGKYIKTPLLDGQQYPLLEIVSKSYRGEQHDETILWVDSNGETMKSYSPLFDIRSYRCPRAMAEKVRDAGLCGTFTNDYVPLSGPIFDYQTAGRLTFRVICDERRSDNFLPSRTHQEVTAKSSIANQVIVHAMSEKTLPPKGVNVESKADDKYLQASPTIQKDDAYVKKIAAEFVEADRPGLSKLEKLRLGVFDWIKDKKAFSAEMLTAAEAARSQAGDSTEHAILLAAVVRSLGVPSRVAAGLVYNGSEAEPKMIYHCWTEVFLRDHWLPIDATTESPKVNATYIKIVDSPLADENPYAVMLPVLRAISTMEIVVLNTPETNK
jgi:transglutaminase-like putative cysteine protease